MSLNTTKLAALAATASVALAGVPAAAAAKATTTGKHTVTQTASVYKKPQVGFPGHDVQGQHVQGRAAVAQRQVGVRHGLWQVKRHGWIRVDVLTK